MERWTDNINGEPYTLRGVRTVRGRVLGDPITVMWKGAGYLAYILTTNIRADGRRINLYMKAPHFQSLLKQIRTRFALVTSTTIKDSGDTLHPQQLSKLTYGKSPTFGSIARVLASVLNEYLFTSFAELNAILGLRNVRAERGKEGSALFKNRGLIYCLLDGSGKRVGVPVKASSFPFNPGLNSLEKKFKRNGPLKRGLEGRIIREIDHVLHIVENRDTAAFSASLKTKAIDVIFKGDLDNRLQEVIYVDHLNKCVFKGVDLASAYGAEGILSRLGDNVHLAMEFEKDQGVHAGDSQQGLSALVNLSQIQPQQDHLSAVKTKRKQPGRKRVVKH